MTPTFKNPQQAFEEAIKQGRLSANETDNTYAGHYMYMGTQDGRDLFKNKMTRQYLK